MSDDTCKCREALIETGSELAKTLVDVLPFRVGFVLLVFDKKSQSPGVVVTTNVAQQVAEAVLDVAKSNLPDTTMTRCGERPEGMN